MTRPQEDVGAEKRLPSLSDRRRAVNLPIQQICAATGLSRTHVRRVLRGTQCTIRALTAVEAEIVKAEAEFLRQFAAAQRQRREEGWSHAADE